MAKKKASVDNSILEIKDNIKKGTLVFGTETTLKQLSAGKLGKIFLSSNPAQELSESLEHYASIYDIEIVKLSIPNDELGIICKKPFSISVIGLQKG